MQSYVTIIDFKVFYKTCEVSLGIVCLQDQVQVSYVVQCLGQAMTEKGLDAEAFQQLVLTTRSVAVTRPTNLARYASKEATPEEDKVKVMEGELFEVMQDRLDF